MNSTYKYSDNTDHATSCSIKNHYSTLFNKQKLQNIAEIILMLQITLTLQIREAAIQTTEYSYEFQMVHKTDRYYFLAQHWPIGNLMENTAISARYEPNVYT